MARTKWRRCATGRMWLGSPRVDRRDRHPAHRPAVADADGDHLHLELEARLAAVEHRGHQAPAEQPVARLVVGHALADGPREGRRAEGVRQAADGRHPREVAAADEQLGSGPRGARRRIGRDEARDLVGIVLAVGIERQDRRRAIRERAREPRSQRGALALVGDLADDLGPGRLRVGGGVVGRAVVDDDHRQVPACGLDDRGDPGALLVARHQRDDAGPGGVGPDRALDVPHERHRHGRIIGVPIAPARTMGRVGAAIDLNADVGEGLGPWPMGADGDLIPLVSSRQRRLRRHTPATP